MCHRIRATMKDGGFANLIGEVEVDEILFGGRDINRHANKRKPVLGTSGKIAVISAIARKGNMV